MKDPYYVLNVDNKATYQEIQKAYRNLSKKTHPDKGGSSDEFNEINKAWNILKDPIRRKLFDEKGIAEDSKGKQNIYNEIYSLFFTIVNAHPEPENINVINVLLTDIDNNIELYKEQIPKINKEIEKLQKLKGKITIKEDVFTDENIFDELIDGKIKALETEKDYWKDFPEKLKILRDIIDRYEQNIGEVKKTKAKLTSVNN